MKRSASLRSSVSTISSHRCHRYLVLDQRTRRKQQMFVGCQILDVNRTIVGPHPAATLLNLESELHTALLSP